MTRYPGYALVRRLMSRRRPIFEAIERDDPWRRVALALRGRGAGAADELTAMAEAAHRLDHPGIARLVAAHPDALAFAWASGRRLDRAGPPASPADRLELAIQIAELVAHAHERGVVLRDLKPGNLLLDRGDGKLHVTLVDLDLARVEGAVAGSSGATGTWGWSAPEQAALDPQWIDRRSDLYALGTTLAFLFSGTAPFSRGAAAVREQLAEDRVAAWPVPPAVQAILCDLVAVERDARRPASEIVHALHALRGERPGGRPAPAPLPAGSGPGDEIYAAFRAAVAAIQRDDAAIHDPLAVARVCLRLGEREAALRRAQAVPGDPPGAIAIVARTQLEAGQRAEALATLDRITALPAAPGDARDVLAAEVAALRPDRALQLVRGAHDGASRVALRELCEAWLAQLDALSWHERLAWSATQPDGDAAVRAMSDTVVALGGAPPAPGGGVDSDDTAAARIDVLFAGGAIDQARQELQHWLERAPDSVALWGVVQRAATAGGGPEVAELAARAIAALQRDHPGDVLDEAIQASLTDVMSEPRARPAWQRCAELLIGGGRIADALDVLASCDTACGPDPVTDRLRAHAWLALDEADLAIAAGLRALRGGTEQPALWHALALAWIRAGNAGDARNAIEMLVRTGDRAGRAARLAFYASLVDDAAADRRIALGDAALAVDPGDADLTVVRALVQIAGGAAGEAERGLAPLCAARPDLALSRSAQLAIRGMTPALAGTLERELTESHAAALDWAAALYFLAAEQPLTAAMFVRDHATAFPALAADAFLQGGDGDALRALAPELPGLADLLARRLR
jgi:tetratricopeptide (TPR) repeat protein